MAVLPFLFDFELANIWSTSFYTDEQESEWQEVENMNGVRVVK